MSSLAFITDDSPVNRKLPAAFMQRLGWTIEEFADAESMLQRLPEIQPALILLDISMPGMSGTEACRIIRTNPAWRDIHLIAYTAHGMAQDREEFLDAGFNDILLKPLSLATLTQAIAPVRNAPSAEA